MIIKVDFDYDADYIYCPDGVALDMDTLIRKFNNWIYDESINHPFWIDDTHCGVCYRGDAIAYWLNEYVLEKKEATAKVVEQMVKEDKAHDYAIIL